MKTNNNISQEQLEAIERYLNRTMEANERLEFDTRLNEDAAFRSMFQETKALLLGIETAALKNELDTFHEEMTPVKSLKTTSKKSNVYKMIPWSIAAILIVAIGVFSIMNTGTSSNKLFAEHFTPDPGLPTVMSTTDEYDFYDAMISYKQENYGIAIQKWEALLINKSKNDTLNYYIGVSYLAEGNAEKAASYLETALESNTSIFKQDAHYYLGLSYLKNNDLEKARTEFEKSNLPSAKLILKALIP